MIDHTRRESRDRSSHQHTTLISTPAASHRYGNVELPAQPSTTTLWARHVLRVTATASLPKHGLRCWPSTHVVILVNPHTCKIAAHLIRMFDLVEHVKRVSTIQYCQTGRVVGVLLLIADAKWSQSVAGGQPPPDSAIAPLPSRPLGTDKG